MASPSLSVVNVSNGHGYMHTSVAERSCRGVLSLHHLRSHTGSLSGEKSHCFSHAQKPSPQSAKVTCSPVGCGRCRIKSQGGLPDFSRGMRQGTDRRRRLASRLRGLSGLRHQPERVHVAPAAAEAGIAPASGASVAADGGRAVEVEHWNSLGRGERLEHLEEQAISALRSCVDAFERPAFPCALIAGDVVILHLLDRLGFLSSGRVKVVFIDTFHLFQETHDFLALCEKKYGFKAEVFQANGFVDRDAYVAKHGSDLFIVDIDEYDRICKVEPFGRALKTLQVDCMINGRRRDHGADRAQLELFEAGDMVKAQPLAYWEFRDCWDYIKKYDVPYHPLHDDGYPSIGDIFSTLPVPKSKWFEYGGERSGRFQGLRNKDGSDKTECGIHVGDAREVTNNSLSSSLVNPASSSLLPREPSTSSILNRPN